MLLDQYLERGLAMPLELATNQRLLACFNSTRVLSRPCFHEELSLGAPSSSYVSAQWKNLSHIRCPKAGLQQDSARCFFAHTMQSLSCQPVIAPTNSWLTALSNSSAQSDSIQRHSNRRLESAALGIVCVRERFIHVASIPYPIYTTCVLSP